MVMARRQPRVSDAVRVPGLRFRDLRIDFGSPDDPRLRINADVEAYASNMNDIGALYDAGAILVGPEASLFAAHQPDSELRLERSIDIQPPRHSGPPILRASGPIISSNREGSVVILAHARSPFQRRPWRITIELDRGERITSNFRAGMSRPVSYLGY